MNKISRAKDYFPILLLVTFASRHSELQVSVGSTAVLRASLQSSSQERVFISDIVRSELTLAVFVLPSLIPPPFFFFEEPESEIVFILLVGHYTVLKRFFFKKGFLLSIAHSLLPVPNYTFTYWMSKNKE